MTSFSYKDMMPSLYKNIMFSLYTLSLLCTNYDAFFIQILCLPDTKIWLFYINCNNNLVPTSFPFKSRDVNEWRSWQPTKPSQRQPQMSTRYYKMRGHLLTDLLPYSFILHIWDKVPQLWDFDLRPLNGKHNISSFLD